MSDFDHNAIVSYIWGIANDVLRDSIMHRLRRDSLMEYREGKERILEAAETEY